MLRLLFMLLLVVAAAACNESAATLLDSDVPLGADGSDAADAQLEQPYRYVRVDHIGEPGFDMLIDAVILRQGEGVSHYASVVQYRLSGEQMPSGTGHALEGPPDAFTHYPDLSECTPEEGSLVLNTPGDYVIVQMPVELTRGDELTVLQTCGCGGVECSPYGSGGQAFIDDPVVSVSVAAYVDGPWLSLGNAPGPEMAFRIPAL